MSIRITAFSHLVITAGLALWMSIAVLNNLYDPGTNHFHLGTMLSMELVRAEELLGSGLVWRSWPAEWVPRLLYGVVSCQLSIACLLWRAVLAYVHTWLRPDLRRLKVARDRAMIALACFVLLWLGFICGGLWFGYWIKQGAIQSVHLALIVIGIGSIVLVQGSSLVSVNSVSADPGRREI